MADRKSYFRTATVALLGLLLGCAKGPPAPLSSEPAISNDYGDWGVDTSMMSSEVTPGTNFYVHVNEGWLNSTKMPPGYAFYSEPWAVQAKVTEDVNTIISGSTHDTEPEAGSAQERIRNLYGSYVDQETIDALGLSVVQDDLDAILGLKTHQDVARWLAKPQSSSVFHLIVKPPADMRGGYVLSLEQYRVTGLGLPGQVYYESDEELYKDHRQAYQGYIAATLERAHVDRAQERSRAVLDLEVRFAEVMWDFARLRDAGAAFELVTITELERSAPGFPWRVYLSARGVSELETINLGVGAVSESAALFGEFSVETWASFLAFHWIDSHAALLPDAFGEAAFEFYDVRLSGIEERMPRLDRATRFVQRQLGDDVGAVYVDRQFSDSHRAQVETMVAQIRSAFRERLLETVWMDSATRAEALKKLDAIIVEIGEPKAGIDWSNLEIVPDDLVGNVARIADYRWAAERERIGQPLSRYGDWNMYPHRIGAGYHQQYNKIFVTAGFLLPPFFDPRADPAVNFGAIGQTIAHEFGHAFDDQGSKFDSAGALRNWWSEASRTEYLRRTDSLVAQYKAYEPLPGVALAADQMIGEIVGDLIGVSISYRAYELYAEDAYAAGPPVLDGFTGQQRFFLGAAQQSRAIATTDAMRDDALHATHPPEEYRVNGVLRNLNEWYLDFDVRENEALYLSAQDRVRLW